MSGGSFNYASINDLFAHPCDLQGLRGALAEYPGSFAAVAVMDEILACDDKFESLRDVLRAVEWHASSDYTEEDVVKALAKYNAALIPVVPAGAPDDPRFHEPR